MMSGAHVRVGVVRAGRRINDRRGNPGRTLCGGALTSYDVDLKWVRRASVEELDKFNICRACRAAANEAHQ